MNPTVIAVLGALLGTAEEIVPVFIHNPQSQKIEAVITTPVNNLFALLAQLALQAKQAKTINQIQNPTT